MKLIYILPAIIFITCFTRITSGQSSNIPTLEIPVTLNASNVPLAEALDTISKQSGAVFSYNTATVNTGIVISAYYNNKPLRMVLKGVLGPDVNFKAKGRYIILKETRTISKDEVNTIEGYVYDSSTGTKLAGASVYDRNLLASAVTNEFGYFSLSVPSRMPVDSIHISMVGYNDMLLLSEYTGRNVQDINIVPSNTGPSGSQNISSRFQLPRQIPLWMLSKKTMTNSVNIGRKVMKTVQLSLFPPLSTNHFLSGNSVNKLSFNTTVGYVYGVDIAEFGGVLNIDLGNVRYFQGAGIGNIVGNNVTGVQVAGGLNYARNVKGVQVGGIFNISADSADYQTSGVLNKTSVNKVQLSGVINLAKSSAVQVSGVMNSANRTSVQISGLVNYSGNADIQVSGLINCSRTIKKLQLGIINIADTSRGVSVGIFSYVKKGYHKIEISCDENLSASIAFSSGTSSFHTILGAGYFFRRQNMSSLIYGVGTSLGRSYKNRFDAEVFYNYLLDLNRTKFIGNLYTLYAGIDHKMLQRCSLAAGLTFNILNIDTKSLTADPDYIHLAPYSLNSGDGSNLRSWIGIRTSLKFF